MADTLRKVIVIGASGQIGAPIVKHLLSSGDFEVSVLTREGSEAKLPEGVTVYKSDYSVDSLAEAFKGKDAVVCAIRAMPGVIGEQFKMIDAALKAGVKRFIPSEYGSDSDNAKGMEFTVFFQDKTKVLSYLREKEKEGLTWTGITTGPFFDMCLTSPFLGIHLKKHNARIWDKGDVPVCFTNVSFAAKAVVAVLQNPDKTANKNLYVASAVATQNELVERLEKDFDKKFERSYTSVKEEGARGFELLQKGEMFPAYQRLILCSVYGGEGCDFEGSGHTLANKTLGLPEPSLDESLKEVYRQLDAGVWNEFGE